MDDVSRLREGMMGPSRPAGGLGGMLSNFSAAVLTAFSACSARKIRINDRTLRIVRQLAEGGFSTVFLCEVESGPPLPAVAGKPAERLCAVKQLYIQTEEARHSINDEISAHTKLLGCRRIMPLLDYTVERVEGEAEKAFLLFPFYSRGSVQDFLLQNLATCRFFEEKKALRMMKMICEGVSAMHSCSPPLAHRDICPRNIMLEDSGEPILIDFGSAASGRVRVGDRVQALQLKEQAQAHSSMPYRALELWEPTPGADVDERSDVWSLGATLYAMLFGYSPFESARGADGKLKLAECTHLRTLGDVQFPTNIPISTATADLIVWMLNKDHAARPTVAEVSHRIDALLRNTSARSPAADGAADDFNPFGASPDDPNPFNK